MSGQSQAAVQVRFLGEALIRGCGLEGTTISQERACADSVALFSHWPGAARGKCGHP